MTQYGEWRLCAVCLAIWKKNDADRAAKAIARATERPLLYKQVDELRQAKRDQTHRHRRVRHARHRQVARHDA